MPRYMGHTFASICRLWVIVQEILAVSLSAREGPMHERIPLAFAESKYQKMLVLADTLEETIALEDHSQPHILIFQ